MFDGVPISSLTAPALLGIAVLMILLGLLIPRRTYREKEKECERWRSAYEAMRETNVALNQQTAELLEVAKTTHSIVAAMFGTTQRVWESGERKWGGSEDDTKPSISETKQTQTRPWRLSHMLESISKR